MLFLRKSYKLTFIKFLAKTERRKCQELITGIEITDFGSDRYISITSFITLICAPRN